MQFLSMYFKSRSENSVHMDFRVHARTDLNDMILLALLSYLAPLPADTRLSPSDVLDIHSSFILISKESLLLYIERQNPENCRVFGSTRLYHDRKRNDYTNKKRKII